MAEGSSSQSSTPKAAPWWVPTALAIGAPLIVIATLVATADVFDAFLAYHIVVCLLVPFLVDQALGYDIGLWRRRLGLVWPSGEGWAAGLLTGLAAAALILAPALTIGEQILSRIPLAAALSGWGVPLDAELTLFLYMVVFNSAAEELFWRGHLQTELVPRLGEELGIAAGSLAFTSYHIYTIASIFQDWRITALGTAGVLAGSVVWAFLRNRYRSVWPAIVSHLGATVGYMTVLVVFV